MPGCGKTYWGASLATYLSRPFVDLDSYIESSEKSTIANLFHRLGEAGFRSLEHQYLHTAVEGSTGNTIIACGGGTPCFHSNLDFMKNNGCVIYLRAPISWLCAHLENEHTRPLLQGVKELRSFLQNLYESRKDTYEKAHRILDATTVSLTIFEQTILSCTDRP